MTIEESNQSIMNKIYNISFDILLPSYSDCTIEIKKMSRGSPAYELFDILIWNVLLSFLVGLESSLVSTYIYEKFAKNKDESIEREEAMKLVEKIIQQYSVSKNCLNGDNIYKTRDEIADLLVSYGWPRNKAVFDSNNLVKNLLLEIKPISE